MDEPTLELIKMPRCGIKDDLQPQQSLTVSNIRDVQKVHCLTKHTIQLLARKWWIFKIFNKSLLHWVINVQVILVCYWKDMNENDRQKTESNGVAQSHAQTKMCRYML